MRNVDGGQWRLRWEATAAGFRGWVERHPKFTAEAASFDEMAEKVCDLVDENLHAGEWAADWLPPPPAKLGSRGGVLESHVSLAWEGRFVCLQDPLAIFASYCDWCGMPTGPRTDARLRMFIEDPGSVCGDFDTAPGKLVIFSGDIGERIRALSPVQTEFRSVERVGRGTKAFVEPVVRGVLPRPVALKGEEDLGWKCPKCGHLYLYHTPKAHATTTFYRRADLPVNQTIFWTVNAFGCADICIPVQWWKEHRNEKWAKGAVGHPIGVAEDSDIDLQPRLTSLDRIQQKGGYRKHWKAKQRRLAETYRKPFEPWT